MISLGRPFRHLHYKHFFLPPVYTHGGCERARTTEMWELRTPWGTISLSRYFL